MQAVDLKNRVVHMHHHSVEYDYVILAMGGVTSYFGHPEWAQFAPGLKSITDAMHIRREILYSFEKAELTKDPEQLKKLMTILIVGGGPTRGGTGRRGEGAGPFRHAPRFPQDRSDQDPRGADRGGRPHPHASAKDLSASAQAQLEAIGVEVRLNTMVQDIKEHTPRREGQGQARGGGRSTRPAIVWAAPASARTRSRARWGSTSTAPAASRSTPT